MARSVRTNASCPDQERLCSPATFARIGTVDESFQSYNVEMLERARPTVVRIGHAPWYESGAATHPPAPHARKLLRLLLLRGWASVVLQS